MLRALFHLLVNILIILGLSALLPNFEVNGIFPAVAFIFILTVLNWTILPIIKILTLPISILTLGFFNIFLNLFAVILVANTIKGVELRGTFGENLFTAFIITLALALGNSLVNRIEENAE